MDVKQAQQALEGLLFVSGQPVPLKRLKEVFEALDYSSLRQLIATLNEEYAKAQHAFRIQEVAGGYQLVTDPQLAPWMKRARDLPKLDVLSKAALETLAIIAYRQPITKAEIELIRGVDGSATLETLLERQFVHVVGRKDSPGRPLLYGTTTQFLRHFGLKGLEDLPNVLPPAGGAPSSAVSALRVGTTPAERGETAAPAARSTANTEPAPLPEAPGLGTGLADPAKTLEPSAEPASAKSRVRP